MNSSDAEERKRANALKRVESAIEKTEAEISELEETMNTISGYYDAELEMATDAAMKKLEPALLIFMAVIAGFIVIAIYMAMFDMYSVM